MAEKRSRKAEEEAKEAKANEQIRRKAGKLSCVLELKPFLNLSYFMQELNKLKDDVKLKQALKDAEDKKRGTIISTIRPCALTLDHRENRRCPR